MSAKPSDSITESSDQIFAWKLTGKSWKPDEASTSDGGKDIGSLHDYLRRALQMHNLIVLAGSGASLGRTGGPSMADLWRECSSSPSFNSTIDTLKYKLTKDSNKENIEELLSTAEAYLQAYPETDIDTSVKTFVQDAKEKILERCSNFLEGTDHDTRLETHRQFLNKLAARRQNAPRVKLFTTNYDLSFEKAASSLGQIVIDGFSFTTPRTYDPRFFDYDILRGYSNVDNSPILQEGVIRLYKLHGSVNWGRKDDQIQIMDKPNANNACIIYPARQKYQQSYIQPHLELISQYLSSLRQPETCVLVIGFGMNDDHLSEPLLGAIESNPRARFIFVSPCLSDHEAMRKHPHWKRVLAAQDRDADIALISGTFEQFVNKLPDLMALSPEEQLAHAVKTLIDKEEKS